MTERNMEDMDKLFREGLNPEGDLFAVPEGEWSKLEKRLVRHEKRKRGVFWLTRLGGVAALLLLFFTLRTYWPDEAKQVVEQTEVKQKEFKQPIGQSKVQQKGKNVKEQPYQSLETPEASKTIGKTESASNSGLVQNKYSDNTRAEERSAVAVLEKGMAYNDSVQMADLSVEARAAESTVNSSAVKSNEFNPLQPDSIVSPDQQIIPSDEPLMEAIAQPTNKPTAERPVRKMALSVLAAPDYNGVDNLSNGSMGSDFGLMVSYAFAKNWTFSTGGIYAKKLYETGYSNYKPAKNIWTEYHPSSVYADCRVLDIPLNISYTILQRKNSSVSAGSGISSYIMLKEDYRFTYAETDSNTPQSYQVVNENQHWLSVLNIQATFEQRLNSRLSVSLQPFMKIPLSTIGFAGVNLQTMGMAANLTWNFNL